MKKMMTKIGLALVIGVLYVGLVLHFGSNPAHARPEYSKCFQAKYPDLAPAKEAKCNVCHAPDDKKKRNEYGKAVGKSLGATKVKDTDKINGALSKAEGEKSGSGETFGDRIKAGKLPAAK